MGIRLVHLLPKKLAKHGLSRPVLAAQVVSAWTEVVEKVAPRVIKSCQALSLSSSNMLSVRCTHATVSSELSLRKDELIALYKKMFPQLKLSIRFQTGELVSPENRRP